MTASYDGKLILRTSNNSHHNHQIEPCCKKMAYFVCKGVFRVSQQWPPPETLKCRFYTDDRIVEDANVKNCPFCLATLEVVK